jgi:lipoate---protein ligase
MHGEYKEPGGKLVVVDCMVDHGQVRGVMLSGDFFLAPDEALGWITAALEGLDAAAALDTIAARVGQASAGAELIGITPGGVAIALRRALDAQSGGER